MRIGIGSVCGFMLACCLVHSACAQQNLGEVLDRGATKLSQAEMESLLIGATLSYDTTPGRRVELDPRPDGRIHGRIVVGRSMGNIQGDWRFAPSGRFCYHITFLAAHPVEQRRCQFWFKLGEGYFASRSDAVRTDPVIAYRVSR